MIIIIYLIVIGLGGAPHFKQVSKTNCFGKVISHAQCTPLNSTGVCDMLAAREAVLDEAADADVWKASNSHVQYVPVRQSTAIRRGTGTCTQGANFYRKGIETR